MYRTVVVKPNEIRKLQLQETVSFAINNIPHADPTTLNQFLELVNAGGPVGTISHEQILIKMRQMLKYMPQTRVSSLVLLLNLLQIQASDRDNGNGLKL